MKRKNLSVVVVLAALLVATIGYALFSQTINITGTATAQGSFSYNIEVQKEVNNEINSNNMYDIYENFGDTGSTLYPNIVSTTGLTSSISNTGNNVTYSVNFTEPGQKQYFTIKVTNTGTIDMSVDYYNPINASKSTLTGTITGKSGATYQPDDIDDCTLGSPCNDSFNSVDYSFVSDIKSHGNRMNYVFAPQSIYSQIEAAEDYVPAILKPNESIYFVISCWLPNISSDTLIKGFDLTASYNISFDFNQATN